MIKVFLLTVILSAGVPMICLAQPQFQPISLISNEKSGVDDIKGEFHVDADIQTAWNVLSDYERIPRFVNGLKKSHVEERHDDYLLLTQEVEGGVLFATKRIHVLLKVTEVANQSISFQDISQKDFYSYQGAWVLKPCPEGGVTVAFHLEAKRNFDMPFAGDCMHGGLKDLLVSVQKEIYSQQVLALNKAVIKVAMR